MKDDITILEMKGITKRFSGVTALDNCELTLSKGEVHCLVGENGAGKSTLVKILCGIYQRDAGTVIFDGQEVSFANPKQAMNDGIFIVHQELNLIPHLSVAQNIFIGKETTENHKFFFSDKRLLNDSQKLFDSLKFKIDPGAKVSTLSVAEQQMVEVAKAVYNNVKILIMDEPTAPLTSSEIDQLFEIIRSLKAQGIAVIYISHRMDELKRISDRITVMRDGQYVQTLVTKDTDISQVIRLMVGHTIYESPKTHSMVPQNAEIVLEAEEINSMDVKDVSFVLRRGEILGFAGLVGAGRTEVMRLLCGADRMSSGRVWINGKEVKIRNPQDAVRYGIGYLSEDRKRFGLCLGLSVADNIVLSSFDSFCKSLFVNTRKVEKESKDYAGRMNIKTPSMKTKVGSLSGGNQQKVVIAKWLMKNCDILIFDEPTRGIDVGAKSEIYKLMIELASHGKSIIMISSEMPELLRLSDRIIVMCEGRVTGELDIAEASQESIMGFATARKVGVK